jgi:hypothetical protein
MAENIFIDGMIAKRPHTNAPQFVKGNLSIKVDEFYEFCRKNSKKGWLNITIKESREGRYYAVLDTYETPADKVYEKTKDYIEEVLQTEPAQEEPKKTSVGYNGEQYDLSDVPF